MAKYIQQELFDRYLTIFPELKRRTTLEDLWNIVYDKYFSDGVLMVDEKAILSVSYNGKELRVEKPRDEIYLVSDSGDTQENYDILLIEALNILYSKLTKSTKGTRKKKAIK